MAQELAIEIDESGAIRWLDRQAARQRLRIRDTIDDIADVGVATLYLRVPELSSYLARHVDREPVKWFPGGTGGGGEYRAVVGIKRGTSRHPLYAEFGTGIYAQPSRGYITAKAGNFLSFYSYIYGRRIRVRRVRGQRAQRYFYATWRDMNVYARARVRRQAF